MALFGGEKKQVQDGVFWRISLVRVYTSLLKKGTPDPFAELRATRFLDHKPTLMEAEKIYQELYLTLDALELNVFESLVKAQDSTQNKRGVVTADSGDTKQLDSVGVRKIGDRVVTVEINGHELQEVEAEEVMRDFKSLKRIYFNQTYNYFALKNQRGEPIVDYDDDEIRQAIDKLIQKRSSEKQQSDEAGI